MKKLFIFVFIILLLGSMSALVSKDFTLNEEKMIELNTKTQYGTIELSERNFIDVFGWFEKDVAKLTLRENTDVCQGECYAIKDIELLEEGSLVDDARFYRVHDDGSQTLTSIKSYDFLIKTGEEPVEVNDYKSVCSIQNSKNGSSYEKCEDVLTGTHTEYKDVWEEYQEGTMLPEGNYTLKLVGEISSGKTYDWQILSNGAWTTEWAEWANPELINDLQHYYKFDSSSGSIGIDSIIGRNISFDTSTWSEGIIGNAKTTGLTKGTSSVNLNGLTEVTINFWLNKTGNFFNDGTAFPMIIENGDTADSGEFYLPCEVSTQNCYFKLRTISDHSAYFNTQSVGTWNMYSVTINQTSMVLYQNGVQLSATNVGAWTMRNSDWAFFYFSDTNDRRLNNAIIDELGIWNKSLTQTEITELYNSGIGVSYPFSGSSFTLNSPADNLESNNETIIFNISITHSTNLTNTSLIINDVVNDTQTISGTSNETIFTKTFGDGSYNWSIQACDIDGDCGYSENRTFEIITGVPDVQITYPTSLIDYGKLGENETLNVTAIDSNLDTCWYEYENTNTTFSCSTGVLESEEFIVNESRTITAWANNSVGNEGNDSVTWDYKIFENSQSFTTPVTEGSIQSFLLNVTIGNTLQLSSGSFNYNNTEYSPSIISAGNNRILNISNFEIPDFESSTNVSFYWTLNLDDSSTINTFNETQEVIPLRLDNCSTYTNELLNISLHDERTRNPINGTIEIAFEVLNKPNYNRINLLTAKFEDVSNTLVCSENDLSDNDLAYSAQIKYYADDYVSELYNIQREDITNITEQLSLFDLASNFSTEFKIIYQDDSYSYVEGAVVQLQRKYIADGIYEIVEAPLTSNEGTTNVHIDLDSNLYRATIVKDGEVLDVFENLVFICENPLVGSCSQQLLGEIDPQNSENIDSLLGITYSDPVVSNETISVSFSIPSGAPATIGISLVQKDQFGNKTLCNRNITSSAGSIECEYSEYLGESYIDLKLTKDGTLVLQQSYILPEEDGIDFLRNNFFIVIILMLSLVGMAFTSPEWIILNGVITFVVAGALWLLSGLSFVIGLGTLMWLIITSAILIFKISRQEDR